MTAEADKGAGPRILVFSTVNISDPGIDLAGGSHMHYPAEVTVLSVPCSSGIRPDWVICAVETGFDGVFIAADGTDCTFVTDCTNRTANVFSVAQELLKQKGYDPRRLKMAAICSVCAESFVSHIENFAKVLNALESG